MIPGSSGPAADGLVAGGDAPVGEARLEDAAALVRLGCGAWIVACFGTVLTWKCELLESIESRVVDTAGTDDVVNAADDAPAG